MDTGVQLECRHLEKFLIIIMHNTIRIFSRKLKISFICLVTVL